MRSLNLEKRFKNLYSKILENKIVTICVLFTFFTLLDTTAILLGFWPAKSAQGVYVHLLGRFVLHSLLVGGLFVFDRLRKYFKSKFLVYLMTFALSWGLLIIYLWVNSFFVELHPDAFVDASVSFAFMYLLLGIVIFIFVRKKKVSDSN